MDNQFRICRVCRAMELNEEMRPIFEGNDKIAIEIFLITSIKIMEYSRQHAPALICTGCLKDLGNAMKLRKRCQASEKWFRNKIEAALVQGENKLEPTIKNEKTSEQIKEEEPLDINELLINIETLTEENPAKNIQPCEKEENEKDDHHAYKPKRKERHKTDDFCSNEVQCSLCLKSFTSTHSMKDHMRAIHQKLDVTDMFKCKFCDRLFKMKYYLSRHIKSFHKKEKCADKPKVKSKKEGEEIFKEKLVGLNCPYCNKFLTSKHSLNDHIRVKHEYINYSERFLCDICGKDFPLKYYLLRHIRASHLKTLSYKKKVNESLPCSICGKILKSKGNLSTHEKTHRVLKPEEYWYCDLCGNKFKGRGEMTVHIKKRHLYKIRYPCDICPNKSWRTLFQLQRHIKVFHHNIREFKCEWCNKEFGEKNKLICHLRIHTGEQPFSCQYCERKFTHQTDLRRHIWGHTGERPYRCEKEGCGKGFMKKSELLAHETRCHINQASVRTAISIPFQYQMM